MASPSVFGVRASAPAMSACIASCMISWTTVPRVAASAVSISSSNVRRRRAYWLKNWNEHVR